MKKPTILAVSVALFMGVLIARAGATQKVQITQATPAVAPMSDGEVRKVDKGTGKITIRHGPLTNLDMPGMTMVFRVKDPAMLEHFKEGDKIKFVAERMNGSLIVTEMESAQ